MLFSSHFLLLFHKNIYRERTSELQQTKHTRDSLLMLSGLHLQDVKCLFKRLSQGDVLRQRVELVKRVSSLTGSRLKGEQRGGLGVVWVCGQLRDGLKESSGGWHLGLPMSRPSPELCHKSPDICQVALPPCH